MQRTMTCLVLALAAGSSAAQVGLPGSTQYASGFRHDAVGVATLDLPVARRLPVHNIGSSGQDGVEIQLDASWGGGVEIDLAPFAGPSPATREFRIRKKGWDGTVKGHTRLTMEACCGPVLSCDFSDSGSTSIAWSCVRDDGSVIASGVAPSHSFSWGLNSPGMGGGGGGGSAGRMAINRKGPPGRNRCEFPDNLVEVVSLNGLPPGVPIIDCRAIEFESIGGSSGDGRVSSMVVTASGMTEFDLVGGSLTGPCRPPYLCDFIFDDYSIYGLGQSHLSEQCAPGGDCDDSDPTDRFFLCDNLGSSGQDGVALDFGPAPGDGGGLQLSRKHTKTGHVTLLKAYDDSGSEVSRTTASDGGTTAAELITFDASMMSATNVLVTVYDENGSATGSALVLGGIVAIAVPIQCPQGGIWTVFGTPPRWGCYFPNQFVLPGGTVLSGHSISMQGIDALGTTGPRVRRVECTGNPQVGGYLIDDPRPPTCPADLDDGTGSGTPDYGVDINDLLFFLEHFEFGC